MSLVTAHVSISLDGFMAGPDQSEDNPLGVGGRQIHAWHLPSEDPVHPADAAATEDLMRTRGAVVMGRNMFGPVRGEWSGDWRGWWGDEPPYHAPVFVLTHHARDPVQMEGGTTFHFVTTGIEEALAQAHAAADGKEVAIAGGASTLRQAIALGAVQQLTLDVAPVLLGAGERLFDGLPDPGLTPVAVSQSPLATHVTYRIG